MSADTVMVVGGGGREHALAWKLAQSPHVGKVWVAPGNAGTALEPRVANVPIAADNITALADFARDNAVALTVVGPEAPLAAGIRDHFDRRDIPCLGPSAAAAELEASKAFAKAFLERHRIPTARAAAFSDAAQAQAWVRAHGAPIVVKADGLAAGKGVVVAHSESEAVAAIDAMLRERTLGDAGSRVLIEEFLQGEEASFIALVDGEHILPLASSQDHKAALDGDRGPNTGGMGAYSPAPVVTPAIHNRIVREIIEPAVRGLAAEGRRYSGFLYAGVMIDPTGVPRVLEFNVRLGDPETQPILMRLESDLYELAQAALQGRLDQVEARWDSRAALGVIMSAGGYPAAYRKGDVITGLDREIGADAKVFHAGTRLDDGRPVTAGGRVLCACARGEDVAAAQAAAYAVVRGIDWADVHYRRDIGWRAVARERG